MIWREVRVQTRRDDGSAASFAAIVRIDTPQEALYYRHGGILRYVMRQLLLGCEKPEAISRGLAAGHFVREPVSADLIEQGSLESFPASDPPSY
jgi:aconitate hydratase A / 2-methylisocitrate dehydratase